MKFRVVLADPPWAFATWGSSASRNAPYETRDNDWIKSLPVQDVCEEDCVLFLWVGWPYIMQMNEIIEAWGFEYKTLAFDWVKKTACGLPRINLGYWTRANSEPCLLATRGKPKRMDKGVSQVIVSGLGEHSEKPEEQYTRIERLVEGPYLELFHRPRNGLFPPRENWTFLGNEVDGKDMADALRELAEKEEEAAWTANSHPVTGEG